MSGAVFKLDVGLNKMERLFQNRKQKIAWVIYLLLVINKLTSLPNNPVKWTYFSGGFVIYLIFITAIFFVIANLLGNKRE